VFFITSNLLTAEDQICRKVLVANEKMNSFIFLLVRLVFRRCKQGKFCNFHHRFLMLQPLRWRCVECVIPHERMCAKNNSIYPWHEQAIIEWLRRMISIVACCRSVTLCAHAARVFDRNKMVLCPGCEGRAGFSLQTSVHNCTPNCEIAKQLHAQVLARYANCW